MLLCGESQFPWDFKSQTMTIHIDSCDTARQHICKKYVETSVEFCPSDLCSGDVRAGWDLYIPLSYGRVIWEQNTWFSPDPSQLGQGLVFPFKGGTSLKNFLLRGSVFNNGVLWRTSSHSSSKALATNTVLISVREKSKWWALNSSSLRK